MTTKKETAQDPSLAEIAGEGFALLQHGIDRTIEWGFKKMKEAEKTKPTTIENPYLKNAAEAGRKTLGFLGRAGQAYYKRYEELKTKKS